MQHTFSKGDLSQMASLGISLEAVEQQLENFRNGFPKARLAAAATTQDGILKLEDADIDFYERYYLEHREGLQIVKFVPASGAATRMFKELYEFSSKYFGIDYSIPKEYPQVKEFIEHIRSFAFFDDLQACMQQSLMDFGDYMDRGDFATIINVLLKEQYMGYGSLPKALLKFHRYGSVSRTPLEEHIVEGCEYAQNSDHSVNIHFTVSPEHKKLFRKKIAEVKEDYERRMGIRLNITLSEQKHYTDTIAVDEYNVPLRDEEGHLIFRPGGHGALIENLNEQRADLVFIKNIDNVAHDWMKHTTIIYKKVLAGLLLHVQSQVFAHLRILDGKPTTAELDATEDFITERLNIPVPKEIHLMAPSRRKEELRRMLNRPIRVCGMVKNQGEPGGGPFAVRDAKGNVSWQIVESAQINRKDPQQDAIFNASTHFNPVDLVCGIKTYTGRRFNLRHFVDPDTGFISKKSKGATTLKSQELPGLWNGAMAHWITLFVEVPLATFTPVKTVNDLLRKEHLEG